MSVSKDEMKALFAQIEQQFRPDKASGLDATIQFKLTGEQDTYYWLQMENSGLNVGEGQADTPRMTLIADADDFAAVVSGKTNAMQAFMSGKLKVKGDMSLAMKLQSIFGL